MKIRTIFAAILLSVATTQAAEVKQIVAAIDKGLKFLDAKQRDGNWEAVAKKITPGDEYSPDSGQYTGRTALAAWTLLAGGRGPADPAVAAAVKFLQANPTTGVYALGVRSQVWVALPETPAVKAAFERDDKLLLEGFKTQNDSAAGFYHYLAGNDPKAQDYDHSVSQFGVLGVWAGSQAGMAVPRKYWELTALSWMSHQYNDGGWSYKFAGDGASQSTVSMTAAGVATLFIAQDELGGPRVDLASLNHFGSPQLSQTSAKRAASLWQGKTADPVADSLDAGIAWVGDHYAAVTDNTHPYYTLFGISRIGAASGRKFIGKTDWYKQGADWILAQQRDDGSFGSDVSDTCLAVLFLERGLAPVMVNKLQYAVDGSKQPTHWNDRGRDANNLARWFGHATEKFFNWQVVTLDAGSAELHDSPILYLSGSQPLNFSPRDETTLRQFVEEGGLILGNADDGRDAFSASFRKLAGRLFHAYEFRELPANHPIYTNQQYPRGKWKSKPSVLGLSNGVRELMLLVPRNDPGKAWQTQAAAPELHQLAADIYLYVADRNRLQFRTESVVVKPDATPATRSVRVARIEYAGNWNAEPGGWRRVAGVSHNLDHVDLVTDRVNLADTTVNKSAAPRLAAVRTAAAEPGESQTGLLGDEPLAHLSGSVAFTLSPAQRAALLAYVHRGGTLLVDAAGGASAFKSSVEAEFAQIFAQDAEQLRHPLDLAAIPTDRVAAELAKISPVTFRHGTTAVVGRGDTLRLTGIVQGGRLVVIYSPLDLTEGMVGQPVDGVVGYSPQTATDIVTAIVRGVAR